MTAPEETPVPQDTPVAQELINEFVVAAHFDLPKVQMLLAEHPALINENATWIETPIQAAAHVGNTEIALYLLDHGAPLDICTASVLGLADEVTALLAEYPELSHATGAHNIPVLFFAALGGHTAIAEMLVAAGTPVDAPEGVNTALHGAALRGQTAMVRWLLDHEANPFTADFEGKTPYERALENGHTETAALLVQYEEAEAGIDIDGDGEVGA